MKKEWTITSGIYGGKTRTPMTLSPVAGRAAGFSFSTGACGFNSFEVSVAGAISGGWYVPLLLERERLEVMSVLSARLSFG